MQQDDHGVQTPRGPMSAMWVHNSSEIFLPEKDVLFFILMHLFEKVKDRLAFGRGFKIVPLKLGMGSASSDKLFFDSIRYRYDMRVFLSIRYDTIRYTPLLTLRSPWWWPALCGETMKM